MTHLAVSVLGEFQVSIDNIPVTAFESDKVRALLAYLAVEYSRAHRREKLIGLLWPDCPEQTARHNLRQALFNLRLALGDHTAHPPYLIITREAIQFNRESDYSLDLEKFNTYFSAFSRNGSQRNLDLSTLVPQLEEMVQLYRGEFLQHFYLQDSAEFEEWILAQREAIHQRAMMVLAALADDAEKNDDFQTARRFAQRQLELDPWREEAYCQVMRVLALDGQRTAALAQYETCRKVLAEELGVDPSPGTRDLYEQIRSDALKPNSVQSAPKPSARIHNLPASLTPFIGREQELANLGRLIADPECRCITLVGPGGIGKTRLAMKAAEQHRSEFSHGAAFVPLVSVGSVEAAIPAMANGIGFAFYGPADPKIQLLNYLRDKQMLLVLDNAEHLLAERTIADLLIEILQQAAAVKLLVTSREALNLQEEWSLEVGGLAFPTDEQTDRLHEFDAVTLFIQRARRAQPGWVMNTEDLTEVVRLCRLVEGMPLAIELAATWVRVLSPAEIVKEIENSLDFLNAQMRDLPERHRSIRAVFDHSWQTLSDKEKQVLSRLSVFRGGFQRQAAEKVANANLSVLASLMTRSLLRRTAVGRYDLHELIRQYAALKLEAGIQELQTAQEQHRLYYLGLIKEKDAQLRSRRQKETLAELTLEIDNIRAAWDCSVTHQKFLSLDRAAIALWDLYELRNWFREGEDIFEKTAGAIRVYLQDAGSKDAVLQTAMVVMLAHCASFKFRQGRSEEAYSILSPSVEYLRTSSNPNPTAAIYALGYIGITCWELGRFTEAKEYLLESLGLAREYGKPWSEAISDEFLGVLSHDQGEYQQSRQYLSEALAIFRRLGDPSMTAHVLSYLGRTLLMLGEYSEAEKLLREGLELTREIDYRFGAGLTLDALGQIAHAQGRLKEAAAFFSESADLFRDMGDTHRLSRTLNHQGLNWLSLKESTEARTAFEKALSLACEGGLIPSVLNALTGIAAIEASQAPGPGTLELVINILQHPSSNKEAKDLASQLRVELEAKLTLKEIETAKAEVGSKNLDELVRQAITSKDLV